MNNGNRFAIVIGLLGLLFAFLALFPRSILDPWFCWLNSSCVTATPFVTATFLPTATATVASQTPLRTSEPTIPATEITEELILYEEDFQDGFADGWYIMGENARVIEPQTEIFVFSIEGNDGIQIIESENWRNFVLEVDYMIVSSNRSSDFLSVVVRSNNGGCPGYMMWIGYSYSNFLRRDANCVGSHRSENGFTSRLNTWHTVRIEVNDNQGNVRGYIDNSSMYQIVDENFLQSGRIEFGTTNFGEVHLDNVRVWSLASDN